MGILQNVITGKQPVPPRLMIYGSEGVGKSTFASNAPKAVFIQTDDGLSEIDCAKLPVVTTYDELLKQLKADCRPWKLPDSSTPENLQS